jgi:hypothetical protein
VIEITRAVTAQAIRLYLDEREAAVVTREARTTNCRRVLTL